MKTFEYLTSLEERDNLEKSYNRLLKTAKAEDYVNEHLVNATMNLKAAITELDRAILAHEKEERRFAAEQKDILNQTLTALGLK